jgi:hypothetical protein
MKSNILSYSTQHTISYKTPHCTRCDLECQFRKLSESSADLTTCLRSVFDAESEKNIFRNPEQARTEIKAASV